VAEGTHTDFHRRFDRKHQELLHHRRWHHWLELVTARKGNLHNNWCLCIELKTRFNIDFAMLL